MKNIFIVLLLVCSFTAVGQQPDSINVITDSLYIASIEKLKGRAKIMHAEPLYIDLIRDLGARKGEREWNFGAGIVDNNAYDVYQALIEYEWAPLNRLGLEIELPFTFTPSASWQKHVNKLNSLKLAAQYTALVHEPSTTSVAIGYLHEFELPAFHQYGKTALLAGHTLSPFFIAAKRFGSNWHGLLYTGPIWQYHSSSKHWQLTAQYNLSSHYMLPGTRNFIGMEVNALLQKKDLDMTIRPQMRLSISDNLLIGIVAGIPVKRENQRMSSFARIIYEPGHKHRH